MSNYSKDALKPNYIEPIANIDACLSANNIHARGTEYSEYLHHVCAYPRSPTMLPRTLRGQGAHQR
jgi:hypothetical protein